MSTLPNGSQRSVTTEEVDAWLLAAYAQLARLHLQADVGSWCSDQRQEVFVLMSDLLMEAFEEIRVVSESMREWSHTTRSISIDLIDLRTDCSRLKAQCAREIARMAQYAPPPPDALREAESQMLAVFKDDDPRQRRS